MEWRTARINVIEDHKKIELGDIGKMAKKKITVAFYKTPRSYTMLIAKSL